MLCSYVLWGISKDNDFYTVNLPITENFLHFYIFKKLNKLKKQNKKTLYIYLLNIKLFSLFPQGQRFQILQSLCGYFVPIMYNNPSTKYKGKHFHLKVRWYDLSLLTT